MDFQPYYHRCVNISFTPNSFYAMASVVNDGVRPSVDDRAGALQLEETTEKIRDFISAHKQSVSEELRMGGRSRLARLICNLQPSEEAPSIQLLAQQSLPTSRDALALSAANSAIYHASCKSYTAASGAADIALILIGVHEDLLRFIHILEHHYIRKSPPTNMKMKISLRRALAISLPKRLSEEICQEVDSKILTIDDFATNFFKRDVPVVLRALASEWLALKTWSDMTDMTKRFGHRVVPVECGGYGGSTSMREEFQTLRQVFQEMSDFNPEGEHKQMKKEREKESVYLAQHPLLDYIPAMWNDIHVPHFITAAAKEKTKADVVNIWMGTPGSGSRLHYDTADNILVQVTGEKTVILISPTFTPCLHTDSNMSPIDITSPENINTEQFPKFQNVTGCKITLRAGDALFIPARHWHWVRAETASISINFWF